MNQRLRSDIIVCKKYLADAVKKEDVDLLRFVKKINKGVCLAVADFKCQKCGVEEDLQWHHLIPKYAKDFMNLWRYISQRHYWANIIILCSDCHGEFHDFNKGRFKEKSLHISKSKILEIKKRYEPKEKETNL